MVFGVVSYDQEVIQVRVAEVKSPENLVHETLKCLPSITEAEWHERELKEAEGGSDRNLEIFLGHDRIW